MDFHILVTLECDNKFGFWPKFLLKLKRVFIRTVIDGPSVTCKAYSIEHDSRVKLDATSYVSNKIRSKYIFLSPWIWSSCSGIRTMKFATSHLSVALVFVRLVTVTTVDAKSPRPWAGNFLIRMLHVREKLLCSTSGFIAKNKWSLNSKQRIHKDWWDYFSRTAKNTSLESRMMKISLYFVFRKLRAQSLNCKVKIIVKFWNSGRTLKYVLERRLFIRAQWIHGIRVRKPSVTPFR